MDIGTATMNGTFVMQFSIQTAIRITAVRMDIILVELNAFAPLVIQRAQNRDSFVFDLTLFGEPFYIYSSYCEHKFLYL